jgi:CubicO group peptidase (beta-lactamase class C family)
VDPLAASLDAIAARTGFSGVVRVDRGGSLAFASAYGLAHRAHRVPNTVDTRFGIASGTKGWTALTVMSLVEDGHLELSTTARSVLGRDLPSIADEVTVEHLLSHRSGIGDYLDEDGELDLTAYLMPVPVHALADTEDYLPVLEGHPAKFPAGEGFSYCNSGYVVLALLAERVAGRAFHELVHDRVCRPAGASRTAFLRSDELPGDAAVGYLSTDGLRSNVLHLPVRGSGDGGLFTTAAEVRAFWTALFAGAIVPAERVTDAVRARGEVPDGSMRYGLGFWLHPSGSAVVLEGCDAGVSFRSVHDPESDTTHTVISNTTEGAWPLARHLDAQLTPP